MRIVQRKEAIEKKLKFYFTGKPCKHGHYSKRYIGSRYCVTCSNESSRRWAKENPERLNELSRRWAKENPEKYKKISKRWYENNKEHTKKYAKLWREKNPERHKANNKQWREANSEKCKAKSKKWAEENPERIKELSKKWNANNKDRKRMLAARRRARKKNAEGTHTVEDIKWLLKKQKYKCIYCKKSLKKKYHVDHIYPLSKGGGNDKFNLQILCPTCNRRKNAKDPIKFAQENGYLL